MDSRRRYELEYICLRDKYIFLSNTLIIKIIMEIHGKEKDRNG